MTVEQGWCLGDVVGVAGRAAAAFQRFFRQPALSAPIGVEGLTPGDFAVIARQLWHCPADDALERLKAEVAPKPGHTARFGL